MEGASRQCIDLHMQDARMIGLRSSVVRKKQIDVRNGNCTVSVVAFKDRKLPLDADLLNLQVVKSATTKDE